jgi:hypothetical protein
MQDERLMQIINREPHHPVIVAELDPQWLMELEM